MAFIMKSDTHRAPVISNPSQSNLDKWLWSCDEMEQDQSEEDINKESAICNGSSKQHNDHHSDIGGECEDIDTENQSIRANNQKTSSNLKMTIASELDKLKSNPKLQTRQSIAGNNATPMNRIKAKQTESAKKDPEVERLREEIESLKLQLSKRTPMSYGTASIKNAHLKVNENNDTKTVVATSNEAGNARLWKTIEELRRENAELKAKAVSLGTSLTKKDRELESIKARYAAIKKENEKLQKQVEESGKKNMEIDDQHAEPMKNANHGTNAKAKAIESHVNSNPKQIIPSTPTVNQRNEFAQGDEVKMESFSPPPPPPPPMRQKRSDLPTSQSSANSNPLNVSSSSVESAFSSISSIKDIQLPPSRAPPSPPRSAIRVSNSSNCNKSIKSEIESLEETAANKLLAITKEQKSIVPEIPLSLAKPSTDAERKRKVTMVNGELMVNTDQGLVRLSDWVRSTANVGSS